MGDTAEKKRRKKEERIALWEKIRIPIITTGLALCGAVFQTIYPVVKSEERIAEQELQDAILKISDTVWEKRAGIRYLKYTITVADENVRYRIKPYFCFYVKLKNGEEQISIIENYYSQGEYISDKNQIVLLKEDSDSDLEEKMSNLLQDKNLEWSQMESFTLLLVEYENCEVFPGCVFYSLDGNSLDIEEASEGQEILVNGKRHQYSADLDVWLMD